MEFCDRGIDVNKHLLSTDGEQTQTKVKMLPKPSLTKQWVLLGYLQEHECVRWGACKNRNDSKTATPPNAHPWWVTACESWSLGAHFIANSQAAGYVREFFQAAPLASAFSRWFSQSEPLLGRSACLSISQQSLLLM